MIQILEHLTEWELFWTEHPMSDPNRNVLWGKGMVGKPQGSPRPSTLRVDWQPAALEMLQKCRIWPPHICGIRICILRN